MTEKARLDRVVTLVGTLVVWMAGCANSPLSQKEAEWLLKECEAIKKLGGTPR